MSQVHQAPNLAQPARTGRAQASARGSVVASPTPCRRPQLAMSQAPAGHVASPNWPFRRHSVARPARPAPALCRRCSGCIAIQPCLSPSPGHNTLRCIAIQCPTTSPSQVTIQNCIVTHFPSKSASSIAIQNLLTIQFQPILAA